MGLDKKIFPKWVYSFAEIVNHHWTYHAPCESFNIDANYDKQDKIWNLKIAPIFQEIYGGEDDGKKVWSPYEFSVFPFLQEPEIWFQTLNVFSRCKECESFAKMTFSGKYKKYFFSLDIFLEPHKESPAEEIIDMIEEKIREVESKDEF
jgi:hypothetical protein